MKDINFEIVKSNIWYKNDAGIKESDKYLGLSRSDDNTLLAIMKSGYNPLSVRDFKDITNRLQVSSGFDFETYQEYKDGRVILGYLKNNASSNMVAGFPMKNYMVIGTSYDGTTSSFIGTSTIMIRCLNSFSQISQTNRIKHTASADVKIEELLKRIDVYFKETNDLYVTFNEWSGISIHRDEIEELIAKITKLSSTEENSTRKLNQVAVIQQCMNREVDEMGSNLFGVLNGFTRYSTHELTNKYPTLGNVVGSGAVFNSRAFDLIKELELSHA